MGLRLFQGVQLFPVRHDLSAKQSISIFAGNASVPHPDKSSYRNVAFCGLAGRARRTMPQSQSKTRHFRPLT
jgi:hypothetical protein